MKKLLFSVMILIISLNVLGQTTTYYDFTRTGSPNNPQLVYRVPGGPGNELIFADVSQTFIDGTVSPITWKLIINNCGGTPIFTKVATPGLDSTRKDCLHQMAVIKIAGVDKLFGAGEVNISPTDHYPLATADDLSPTSWSAYTPLKFTGPDLVQRVLKIAVTSSGDTVFMYGKTLKQINNVSATWTAGSGGSMGWVVSTGQVFDAPWFLPGLSIAGTPSLVNLNLDSSTKSMISSGYFTLQGNPTSQAGKASKWNSPSNSVVDLAIDNNSPTGTRTVKYIPNGQTGSGWMAYSGSSSKGVIGVNIVTGAKTNLACNTDIIPADMDKKGNELLIGGSPITSLPNPAALTKYNILANSCIPVPLVPQVFASLTNASNVSNVSWFGDPNCPCFGFTSNGTIRQGVICQQSVVLSLNQPTLQKASSTVLFWKSDESSVLQKSTDGFSFTDYRFFQNGQGYFKDIAIGDAYYRLKQSDGKISQVVFLKSTLKPTILGTPGVIKVFSGEKNQIEIFNFNGQLVKTFSGKSYDVVIPSGLYIIKLNTEKGDIFTQKVSTF